MAKKDKKDQDKDTQNAGSDGTDQSKSEGGEIASPSPKKKKILLFAGIGAIGLIAASVGGFFVMKTLSAPPTALSAEELPAEEGSAEEAQSEDPSAENVKDAESKTEDGDADENPDLASESADKSDGKDVFGDTLDLPRMELNLGNPLENRFLRFGISIEYHGGEQQLQSLQRRTPLIKDVVITLISKKTRMELLSPTGKEAFRKQLKNTLNEVLEKPVTNVYFTEFLVE